MANTFLSAERDRWPLWLPVFLGTGCGFYFALPFEPAPVWGWAALAGGLVLAVVAISGRTRWPLGLAAALLLGFGAAKLSEMRLATPVLDGPVVTHMTARVVSLEPRGTNMRAVLDQVRSGALEPAPRRIRVSFRSAQDMRPGDWLSFTARLDTPPRHPNPAPATWGAACSSSPSARWVLPMEGRIRLWRGSRQALARASRARSKRCA